MPTTPRLPFDDAPLPDARDRADAVDPSLNIVLEAFSGRDAEKDVEQEVKS